MTKKQRRNSAQRAGRKRSKGSAAAKLLKAMGIKGVKEARIRRNKGSVTIIPIRNPGHVSYGTSPDRGPRRKTYYVQAGMTEYGPFSTKAEAKSYAAYLRRTGTSGARVT